MSYPGNKDLWTLVKLLLLVAAAALLVLTWLFGMLWGHG